MPIENSNSSENSDLVRVEVEAFIARLRRTHRDAGDPSYSDIIRGAGPRVALSRATISRTFNTTTLPKWKVTEDILRGCGLTEGEIAQWKFEWIRIADLLHPVHRPAESKRVKEEAQEPAQQPEASPPGAECETCGAWVTNQLLHGQWHRSFERRRRLQVVRDGVVAGQR